LNTDDESDISSTDSRVVWKMLRKIWDKCLRR
jgi:hypothetical protein